MAKRKKIQSYRHGGAMSFRPSRAVGGTIGGVLGTGAFAALGLPPQLGTLIGSQVGGLLDPGGLFGGDSPEEKAAKLLEQQREQQSGLLKSQDDQRRLNAYPTFGVRGATVFANGGIMPTNRTLRDELLVPPRAGTVQDLSGNVAKFEGRTHGEGGIPLDANQDGLAEVEVEDQEVIKDDKIFSDRLRVPDFVIDRIKNAGVTIKPGATFAEVAEKLGRVKGKFEEKLESRDPAIISTGKIMTQRIDDLMEGIFQVQETNKPLESNTQQLAHGGMVSSKLGKFGHLIPMEPDTMHKLVDGGTLSTSKAKEILQHGSVRGHDLSDKQKRFFGAIAGGSPATSLQGGGFVPLRFGQNFQDIPTLGNTGFSSSLLGNNQFAGGFAESDSNEVGDFTSGLSGLFEPKTGVGRFIDRGAGSIAGALQFLGNERSINKLVTNVPPVLAPVPRDQFVDRSGLAKAEAQSLVQTGLTNLGRTGIVNRGAASSIIGQGINASSRIANAENIRRDQFESRLRDQQTRVNALNVGAANRGNAMNAARINDQIALRVQNRGALTQGIVGNVFANQQRDQTNKALAIRAFQSGDRGTINRMARDLGFDTTEGFLRSLLN